MHATKKPWLAFLLSFVLPGAGLCYADKWGWGVVNFVVVQIALLMALNGPVDSPVYEYFHYLVLILSAGSAGVAHAVTAQLTRRHSVSVQSPEHS